MDLQFAALVAQVGELTQELRELRRENADLRRQLASTMGVHQPYALPTPPAVVSSVPPTLGSTSDYAPPTGRSRPLGELSPGPKTDANGDTVMSSPPTEGDPKRVRRSLAAGLESAAAAVAADSAAPSAQ